MDLEISRDGKQPRVRRPMVVDRDVIVLLIALSAAHVAWLVIQARSLWSSSNYQHFPLVIAGSLVLGFRAYQRLGSLDPGGRRASWVLVGLALAFLSGACLLASPWLGAVAAMVTLMAAVHAIGGGRLVLALLPAWTFLWFATPPMVLGNRLEMGLQNVSAEGASGLLDLLGILHVIKGNSIDVAGHQLLIGEACSGARSFWAVQSCTLFFVFWARRTAARSIPLLLAAAAWVLFGNVARIATVALGYARWGIDLGEGPAHEALGGLSFALVLWLTYSTDAVLSLFSEVGEGTRDWPVDQGETTLPDLRRTWLTSRPVAVAFGLLALVQYGLVRQSLADAITGVQPETGPAGRFSKLAARSLPTDIGPFRLLDFKEEVKEPSESMGDFSWIWRYDFRGRKVVVSVDAPMGGWHELGECYRSIGWMPDGPILRELGSGESVSGGPAFDASFNHVSPGRHGYLVYEVFDRDGQVCKPNDLFGRLRRRVASSWRRLAAGPREGRLTGYQFQVFVEGDEPLTDRDRAEVRALFGRLGSLLPLSAEAVREASR